MAGFVKNGMYDWLFELKEGMSYIEFKGSVETAFKMFNEFKIKHPDAKLICNGKLVGKAQA